jgi:hypothetical protein
VKSTVSAARKAVDHTAAPAAPIAHTIVPAPREHTTPAPFDSHTRTHPMAHAAADTRRPAHALGRPILTRPAAATAPAAAAPTATQHAPVAIGAHGAQPEQPATPIQTMPPVSAAGASSAGSGGAIFFALLMGLLTLAAIHVSRLRIAPTTWRSVALVSSNERPG